MSIAFLALSTASCVSNPPPPTSTPDLLPAPLVAVTHAVPTRPAPTPSLVRPPTPSVVPALEILVRGLPSPDDLLLAPDGSVYISDVQDGTVKEYGRDGTVRTVLAGLNVPEGMLALPDGSLIIAEQGANRLVRFDPRSGARTLFLALPNRTGQEGVDGIAYDPRSGTIIVPDSPNGTVLRVSPDGKTVRVIARGLARPTGAWAEADGSILVVEENGNALDRIRVDGTLDKLARLPIPDDVIEDAPGDIFVNTLGDGAVHRISASSGQDVILADGLLDPQGLIFDADGNLLIADAGHHELDRLTLH